VIGKTNELKNATCHHGDKIQIKKKAKTTQYLRYENMHQVKMV